MPFSSTDTPADFAEQLWERYESELLAGGWLQATTRQAFLSYALPLAYEYHASIFDTDGEQAADGARTFFQHLNIEFPRLPAAWFNLFHEAAKVGLLGQHAWGVAARVIYTSMHAKKRGRGASRQHLEGFLLAHPAGIMAPHELASLATAPSMLTLYRGANAATLADAVRGFNWTASKHNATIGLYRRQQGFYGAVSDAGRDYLLRAQVPREAVVALLLPRFTGPVDAEDYQSMLIDFDRIDLAEVEELPTSKLGSSLLHGMIGSLYGNLLGSPKAGA